MNIIKYTKLYFAISLLIILPGLISLIFYGLKPSIDFAGGSRFIYQETGKAIGTASLEKVLKENNVAITSIQAGSDNTFVVRTKQIDQGTHTKLAATVRKELPHLKEISFETIGPTVSSETAWDAVKAVLVSCLLIVLYIAWSFRNVPKPASSWRFAVCTIVALLHDVLVVIGVFSLLGHFFGVEIDSLFVTAVLTVIGFSVHDTIVVFDRIRENLRRATTTANFPGIVNDAIVQTLGRSLNTSLTVLLVLFALLLFGGESTKWFVVALLVGILSGTYSSIFNAAPLLVVWEQWSRKKKS